MPPKRSPPKYRHDGTSPLPLGMDWSSPPRKWAGKDTIWPHDPHTGWSYCVTVPSWAIQPESGASDDSLINPIVFYRVQVGIQSPEGICTANGLLRRFSDFLKLFSALKKAFPKKSIPAAPPKHALLRINSSRLLLEERRYALEEWIGRLLSDIDISRSVHVASFLELEAAARSSFQDVNHHSLETNPSIDKIGLPSALQIRASSGASIAGSSLVASTTQSVASDCGSDNAYEASAPETPIRGRGHDSEIGTEDISFIQELSSPELVKYGMSGHDSRLLVGDSIVSQSEEIARSKMKIRNDNSILGRDVFFGKSSGERMEFTAENEQDKFSSHARKHSAESIGSDISSVRGSELSNPGVSNSTGDGFGDLPGGLSVEMQFPVDAHIVLPLDQRHKLNRVLLTMQRRLVTAKTDTEDLIARLNQEMAVKEYLSTKVKDLEVELESTKQRSKENLKQAILVERERITQMQWDMDELRRKSLEMESKLKFEENERNRVETERTSAIAEKEILLRELDIRGEKLENLQKHLLGLEMKSKGDIKVLVKEVKFLRNSQAELKDILNQSMKEKTELERVLQKEKQRWRHTKLARKKLLHECGVLRQRLQECSVNFLAEEEDKFSLDTSSLSDALDLLTTSDNRIGLLLAEAQLLAQDDDENATVEFEKGHDSEVPGNITTTANGDDFRITDDEEEVRKTLADTLVDNARLRRHINSVIRCALNTVFNSDREEDGDVNASRKTVLNKFLESR